MIAIVAVESLFGIDCPLTTWEDALREKAGGTVEQGDFIGRWVHDVLFLNVPHNAMLAAYCLFGLAVLLTLLLRRPRRPGILKKTSELNCALRAR